MTNTTFGDRLMGSAAHIPEAPPAPVPDTDEAADANQRFWYELINERVEEGRTEFEFIRETTEKFDPFLRATEGLLNFREGRIDEDGVKVRKQIKKPIKTWYWRDSVGQMHFSVRVANKRIELAKGSTDIIVGDETELPQVVATVLKAVEAGELDKAVTAAVAARKKLQLTA